MKLFLIVSQILAITDINHKDSSQDIIIDTSNVVEDISHGLSCKDSIYLEIILKIVVVLYLLSVETIGIIDRESLLEKV